MCQVKLLLSYGADPLARTLYSEANHRTKRNSMNAIDLALNSMIVELLEAKATEKNPDWKEDEAAAAAARAAEAAAEEEEDGEEDDDEEDGEGKDEL